MLSEVLLSSKPKQRVGGGLSISGLFPCPYSLYRTYLGGDLEEVTAQQEMLMDDGKWQEEQTVQRLKLMGVIVKDRQRRVTIGKANTPGHIDGVTELDGVSRLFEHKAMSWERFSYLKQRGLGAFPTYKAQVQGYMLGLREQGFLINEADFFAKHKDSCEPYDFIEEFNERYILEIVSWVDAIILESWVPKPALSKLCAYCGLDCFKTVIDMSWIATASAPEMVEKWKQGKAYQNVGKMLEDEAREYFIGYKDKVTGSWTEGLIGDRDVLMVEDLEIKRIIQHRFDVKREKVLEVYGAEGLMKVGEEKDIISYRVREV